MKMDEYEIQELELQWCGNGNWYDTLMENLQKYILLRGRIQKESELTMLENLCELQDNISVLNRYSDSYTNEQIKI